MKHFTQDQFKPKEQTLQLIRQYAYSFHTTTPKQAIYLN